MTIINKKANIIFGIYIIITIILLIAIGPYLKLQDIVTTVLLPLLTVLAITQDVNTFNKNNREFLFLLSIFLFSIISIYYYVNYEALIRGYSSFFGTVLAAYIPVAFNKNNNYSDYFHLGYIASILILIIIMYTSGNFSFTNFATNVDYRDRFLLNANQYSYFSFFANFSLFYLHQKNNSRFWTILLISIPIVFIIVSFVTQSRAGMLLIIVINSCYWFFINKEKKSNQIYKSLRGLLILIAFVALAFQFLKIYENSRIKNRVQALESKADSRETLVYESFKVFEDNPFLGVGLNQLPFYNGVGQFSHNSYIEILAEQGVFGALLLLCLFFIPLKKCLKYLRKNPNNIILKINLLFFITFYIYNNAYVFYKFPYSMMYFFLIISIQNRTIKNLQLDKVDHNEILVKPQVPN